MVNVHEKVNISNSVIQKIESILGKDNVLRSIEERYCYAYDATAIGEDLYLPDLVVLPSNKNQVSEILKIANENNIPIVARGAGTNLAGGCIPLKGGIIIHFSKMNKIISVDKDNLMCTVQPGVVVDKLQKEVEKDGLFYPPDPSNLKVSTIGGSVALSSSGPRFFKYGGTKDYVIGLKVVLADGTIMKVGGNTVKNATGYNFTQLLIGSEGTLGIVTEITLRLIPMPEDRKVLLAFFDSIDNAANTVTNIISSKITPATLDLMDKNTMQTIENFHATGLSVDMDAALVIEVDGFSDAVSVQMQQILEICNKFGAKNIRVSQNEQEREEIWFARRSAFGAVARLRPNVVTEDAVVPRDKIPEMIKEIRRIADKYNLLVCIMGHAGDGNIHPNFSLDLRNENEARNFEMATAELFDAAIRLGGTLSGEHGIGMAKAKYLNNAIDNNAISYMKMIKGIFDPKGILNPGKIFYLK
ncbi:MAG: glycolate oxidase subunit GlcD [Candidatus Melainabacteria bacterium RIFOXYA12_FULL_32_12]|nr:MAG: glycolate oxidase subunit GlcD [Candidatus Melainabacteria bacterium RIFOXYA2_FULL_32_9]OGI30405.1 MAG: glycolate oxidase subunit GlcD [Candidatus Melainabacteria bacterium RIFOXYA12_FULL_32_12]